MRDMPARIGKYTVTRVLGRGAMGTVYEGFDPVIERKVAIKTILREALSGIELEEAMARFRREAQAGGRLQHPAIVAVYEYGTDGDMAFIVMEHVAGDELRRILASGQRYALIDVFEIMKQLLGALDYSHRQGVVHRDIKPANLMVLPGPKVKVMDFGIARLEASSLTQVGMVVGTPTHMAPEQLMGKAADGRSDLWAAGAILYELLTGVSPFLADTPAAVLRKVLQDDVPPPSTLEPSLPKGFDGVVARALARDPQLRFQGAREFQAALLQALQGKPLAPATPRPSAPPAAHALALAPEVLTGIERALSRQIGPLARVLVKRSQGEARTFDQFVRLLGEHIDDEGEKVAFVRHASELQARDGGSTAAFTPEALAAAEKALASYVGPLARILIKDAAGRTGNLKELYAQLAAHIDSEDERRHFLAALPR